ncbi:hypothetical protein [Pisciglobus halotolerans]|uniref:Uncharacterized protein n=1 Tax=Pisciglobus halotolerans TaxID=745365 RepID=A0A1I3BSB7_9LACT|nr:hypothetical protein [Pisciglobus halotolerans]SFH65113.1 hypothetical protein SAMN04489868_10913 [Pisciglobus halotolerans]
MSVKRFVQLFLFYFVSILISHLIVRQFSIDSVLLNILLISVIGYIILVMPLTIMTVKKQKKD